MPPKKKAKPKDSPAVKKELKKEKLKLKKLTVKTLHVIHQLDGKKLHGTGMAATRVHTCTCNYGASLPANCENAGKWMFTVSCFCNANPPAGFSLTCNDQCISFNEDCNTVAFLENPLCNTKAPKTVGCP